MSWAHEYILLLLILLFPLGYIGKKAIQRRYELLVRMGYSGINWFFIEVCALLTMCTCIVLALAQPRMGYQNIEVEKEHRDILILFDVSRSMWSEDVSPSRLKQAQRELIDLISIANGERIGLIVFAKHPYPRMPLTTDYDMIETLVPELSPSFIESQGSNIKNALNMAYDIFVYDENAGGQSILLISDGETESDDQMNETLAKLQKKGIPVYVMGMGTEEGSTIPLPNGGYVKDEQGEKVLSKRATDNLKHIAQKTNGAYISSSPSMKDIELLYTEGIRKTTVQQKSLEDEMVYNEYFIYFVFLAFVAWIISLLPIDMKTTKPQHVGKKHMSHFMGIFFLGCLSFSARLYADDDSNPNQMTWTNAPNDLQAAEEWAYHLFSSQEYTMARQVYESIFFQSEDSIGQKSLCNAALAAHKEGQLYKSLSYLQKITDGPYEKLAREIETKIQTEIQQRLEEEKQNQDNQQESSQNHEDSQKKDPQQNSKNKETSQGDQKNQEGTKENAQDESDVKTETETETSENQQQGQDGDQKSQDASSSKNPSSNSNAESEATGSTEPKDLDDIEAQNTPSEMQNTNSSNRAANIKNKEEQILEDLQEKRPGTIVNGYISDGGMTW